MNIDFQKLVIQKHVIDSSTHEKSKKLSVAYGVDRNFLFGSGISMTSVLVNNPDIDIHFYIVTDYIDDD
ncbi:glycosyltransferase, partial [Citrobacter freundii]